MIGCEGPCSPAGEDRRDPAWRDGDQDIRSAGAKAFNVTRGGRRRTDAPGRPGSESLDLDRIRRLPSPSGLDCRQLAVHAAMCEVERVRDTRHGLEADERLVCASGSVNDGDRVIRAVRHCDPLALSLEPEPRPSISVALQVTEDMVEELTAQPEAIELRGRPSKPGTEFLSE